MRKYRNKLNHLRMIRGGFQYDSNTGGRRLEEEGVEDVYDLWAKLDEHALENVTGLSVLVKHGYRVFLDTERVNSFFVMKNGKIWRYAHKNGLYTRVEEDEFVTYSFFEIAQGRDLGGEDPRVRNRIEEYRGMANILLRDRKEIGPRMNQYHGLWNWTKYMQWVYELGAFRQTRLENLNPLHLSQEFRNRAIQDGVARDEHEWRDLPGFQWRREALVQAVVGEDGEIARDQNGDIIGVLNDPEGGEVQELNLVHNILDDDMQGYSGLQTVEKNKEGFTKRQVKRANIARSGYHMLGAIDPKLFKMAIRGNFFKNCPITEEDLDVADKIYGPSASTLKGKTKRKTPDTVVDDWIEIPKELLEPNANLDLCIDIMFINNVALFVSIDKAIKFRFCCELENRTKDAIYRGIDKILRK